ncbi:MAG: transcription antitermination factor NusB [Caulobacteraceae bacterium]
MSRRLAREYAVKFLYSIDFNKDEDIDNQLADFFDSEENVEEADSPSDMKRNDLLFSEELIKGTLEKLDSIDDLIQSHTVGWTKERIARVDLAVLRLALYEILYRDDIPDSVAINEAIELAKKYSTDESGGFINGILGKIIRDQSIKGE